MKGETFFRNLDREYKVSDQNRFQTINLDLNENLFGCDPRVLQAVRQVHEKLIYSYPRNDEFEMRYARSMNLQPEQVMATNGADAGIEVLVKAMNPDTTIVIPYPTFGMYEICAGWYGLPVERVWYDQELTFPLDRIIQRGRKGKCAFFLANPDSPTGGILDLYSLEKLVKAVAPNLVIVDETYYQYAGISAVPLLKEYRNLIILHSFSKVYGLAGLRIGVLMASQEVVSILRKWVKPFEVNQVALIAAMEALRYPEYVKEVVKKVEHGKITMKAFFEEMGFTVRLSWANFLLIRTGVWTGEIVRKLEKTGILVKEIHYPPVLEGWIRMNVGPEELMQRVMTEFRNVLEDMVRISRAGQVRH